MKFPRPVAIAGAIAVLSSSLMSAPARPLHVQLDAAKTGAPISPYIYGQFIEHLGRCIYGGIWAEMLEDRKFYFPITADYARLDFNMTDPLDKDVLTAGLAALVAAAHPIAVGSITDEELDANPALVKSMSVQPPRGSGTVRTIRIGEGESLIDLQPCGGTHVANTQEIGAVLVTKIEKKSATTRRVVLGWNTP